MHYYTETTCLVHFKTISNDNRYKATAIFQSILQKDVYQYVFLYLRLRTKDWIIDKPENKTSTRGHKIHHVNLADQAIAA